MGQQQRIEPADGNAKLKRPHGCAAPGIDPDRMIACLDQRAGTKTFGTGDGVPVPRSVTRNPVVTVAEP
jgi:hypothetical protein